MLRAYEVPAVGLAPGNFFSGVQFLHGGLQAAGNNDIGSQRGREALAHPGDNAGVEYDARVRTSK